jgi:uncharacterized membrane protein (DUF4010 family)
LRVFGARRGLPLAGLIGALVSGAATVASMASRAAREPALHGPAVAAAVLATVTTVALDAAVIGAISTAALAPLIPALVAGGVAALACSAFVLRRGMAAHEAGKVELGRAFDLKAHVLLALTITAVLLGSTLLRDSLCDDGVVIASGLAGFADAQATAGSLAWAVS